MATLKTLASSIATQAGNLAKGSGSLVRAVCVYGLVFAKVNGSSVGKGVDEAHNAVEKQIDAFSAGYIDKAMSQARAVLKYGGLETIELGASGEEGLIAEATAILNKVDLKAAIEKRKAANAGKKGGRPKAQPAPVIQVTPPQAPSNADPLSIETAIMTQLAQLIDMGDTAALGRIATQLNAHIFAQMQGQKLLAA